MTKRIPQVLYKRQGRPRGSKTDLPEDYTPEQSGFLIELDKWKLENKVRFPTVIQIVDLCKEYERGIDMNLKGIKERRNQKADPEDYLAVAANDFDWLIAELERQKHRADHLQKQIPALKRYIEELEAEKGDKK